MDDLKLSNVDPAANDKLIKKLKTKYETIEKGSMKVTRGKNHTFLKMLLDFSFIGEVKIRMLDSVMELIKKFLETMIKGK